MPGCRGSQDATLSKALFLHLPTRHPSSYPELDVSPLVQASSRRWQAASQLAGIDPYCRLKVAPCRGAPGAPQAGVQRGYSRVLISASSTDYGSAASCRQHASSQPSTAQRSCAAAPLQAAALAGVGLLFQGTSHRCGPSGDVGRARHCCAQRNAACRRLSLSSSHGQGPCTRRLHKLSCAPPSNPLRCTNVG